jgi:hypothetical protein
MSVPRFFLVYIAMAFAVASLSYGLYEFFKFFLVEDKIILSACNKIKNKKINNQIKTVNRNSRKWKKIKKGNLLL